MCVRTYVQSNRLENVNPRPKLANCLYVCFGLNVVENAIRPLCYPWPNFTRGDRVAIALLLQVIAGPRAAELRGIESALQNIYRRTQRGSQQMLELPHGGLCIRYGRLYLLTRSHVVHLAQGLDDIARCVTLHVLVMRLGHVVGIALILLLTLSFAVLLCVE